MNKRTCCTPSSPSKKRLLPIILAVVGFVLLLCCLPLWAVFAIIGLGLIVFALLLLCG